MVNKTEYYQQKLLKNEFLKISSFIEKNYGIQLPESKLIMVQTRLIKRLIAIERPTFKDYVKFVFSPAGKAEVENMVNEITTNKTDFFREIVHFKFLSDYIIGKYDFVKIWSAGCSTGEEPYSIAIHLNENKTDYQIFANDLSKKALEKAKAGMYPQQFIRDLEPPILKKYFKKIDTEFKINEYIKEKITYSYINLMDDSYKLPTDFDIIFFRNVTIYFNAENQVKVLLKMAKHLKKDGYLILGLSENILKKGLPFKNLGLSIFQKI